MTRKIYEVDLCVIGAGSGGLSVAAGAAQLGRSTILFEAGEMGGDCLNYGCVPSKSLIAAAHQAQSRREGEAMGISPVEPKVDFKKVMGHVQNVIAAIAPHDSQERFEGLGATVIRETARFKDARTVISKSAEVRAKRIVVASGSRAAAPPIPGLKDVKYLTNENIFKLISLPKHLIIIGAGPIGLELGQSFSRLGSQVSIIDIAAPLPRNDPAHVKVLIEALKNEGVVFYAPAMTEKISQKGKSISVSLKGHKILTCSHLLVAAGRRPNIEALDLDAAGITYNKRGIETDDNLRSSNRRVFAIGDVAAGRGGLTHIAGHHAGLIIKQFYFMPPGIGRLLTKASNTAMPAAIYTQPELATIGMGGSSAEKEPSVKVLDMKFGGIDRALAEGKTLGSVKIYVSAKGKILGGSILGEGAGDMIQMLALAMSAGVKLSKLAQFISPYPTRTEAVKRAAGSYYTNMVFSEKSKKLAEILTKLQS